MTQKRERTETEEERQTTPKDQDGIESTGVSQSHRAKRTQTKTTKCLLPQNRKCLPHSTASGKIFLMNQEPNKA